MITKYRASERYHSTHPLIVKVVFTEKEFKKAKTLSGNDINLDENYFDSFDLAKTHILKEALFF